MTGTSLAANARGVTTPPSLQTRVEGFCTIVNLIIYKNVVYCRNPRQTPQIHSDPHPPVGVPVPLPIRVWCSRVQVWVDKKKPGGHPCHALPSFQATNNPFALL